MSTPNYTVAVEDSQYRVYFREGISNICDLEMSPTQREPELNVGDWLVLAFAVWGAQDRHAIDIACSVATSWPQLHVGVRPFEYGDEFVSWVPEFRSDAGALQFYEDSGSVEITSNPDDHPVWIALRNGALVGALVGNHSDIVVVKFVNDAFQKSTRT